jgi:hypothetical protein
LPERLHCCYIYFHCSHQYNYYHYLESCALNAEFQHFIPRKPPSFADLSQRGDKGVKRGPKTGWRQDDFEENSNILDWNFFNEVKTGNENNWDHLFIYLFIYPLEANFCLLAEI